MRVSLRSAGHVVHRSKVVCHGSSVTSLKLRGGTLYIWRVLWGVIRCRYGTSCGGRYAVPLACAVGAARCGGERQNLGCDLRFLNKRSPPDGLTFHIITISCLFPLQSGGSLEVFSNPRFNKQEYLSSTLLIEPQVRRDGDDSRSTSIVVSEVRAKPHEVLHRNQFIRPPLILQYHT